MPQSEKHSNPRLPEDEGGAPVALEDAVEEAPSAPSEPTRQTGYSSSRYIDYETHELLEKIAEYEDERRWQRIREGIWISLLLHFLLFSGLTWIPRYVFHRPQLIDPFQALKNKEDVIRLNDLNDARKEIEKLKKAPAPKPQVDKKTLDQLKAMEKARPKATPPPPTPEVKQPQQQAPPAPVETPKPQEQPQPAPPAVAAPQPAQQLPQEAPRPAPVPARPNFSLGSQNPEDQLRNAMRNSRGGSGAMSGPGLAQHHSADGGVQVLSDTQGVDFGPYLQKVIRETYRTWDPLIPEEVNPPILKKGQVEIVFTILPNGRLQPHAMLLTGRSGDVALDRAAWGAIEGADYPPLPSEFHGPYLQLRFRFEYNMR
ncbi:MAG TPA: energy transducer TonB [Acidobacteriaceae bacterium]